MVDLLHEGQQIPATFYEQILDSAVKLSPALRFYSLASMVLQQALQQLDPQRKGLALQIVQCTPPRGEAGTARIRSLRKTIGVGTPPWERDLEQQAFLLGVESLAGHAVLRRHTVVMNMINLATLAARYDGSLPHQQSAAACPIMRTDCVAGCLLVSSTQGNYFGEAQLALIQRYTNLLTLAFEPEEFYSAELFTLQSLPSGKLQQRYFADFKREAIEIVVTSDRHSQPPGTSQVDTLFWQMLEEELLKFSSL